MDEHVKEWFRSGARYPVSDLQLALYKTPSGDERRRLVRQWLLDRVRELREIPGGKLTWLGAVSKPPWCPRCHFRHWGPERETCMPIAKRERITDDSGNSSAQMPHSKGLSEFANVWEFLSMRSWPDGASRAVGTLTITTEGILWKCTLKDRDSFGVAFVSAATLDVLLAALNKGIQAGTLEWREDKFQGGNGKRRA